MHISTHTERDQFDKYSGKYVRLESHVKTCGKRKGTATFDCSICMKLFLEKRHLMEHMLYKQGPLSRTTFYTVKCVWYLKHCVNKSCYFYRNVQVVTSNKSQSLYLK